MKTRVGAVVYAPVETRARWIERELRGDDILIQTGRGIGDVISALIDDPPPRPQILVIDFDAVHPAEILELHAIRDRGWTGTIFALGDVPPELRKSLRIDEVLTRLVDDALRGAVNAVGFDARTRKLPVVS